MGKDLVIVDPESRKPVGMLPDFRCNLESEGDFSKRMAVLYRETAVEIKEKSVRRIDVTLDMMSSVVR